MSELLEVLEVHREEITRTLARKLKEASCPGLSRLQSGRCESLLTVLRAGCSADGEKPVRDWARALRDEKPPAGFSYAEVLEGLGCLERVVRYHVVKAVSQKKALLGALAGLAETVELMRRSCLDGCFREKPGENSEAEDFFGFSDSASELICLTTLHGRPFYLNRAGRQMLGLQPEDPVPAASLHEYYDENSWAELRDVAVPAVRETGHWKGRSRLHSVATGEFIDVSTTVFLVRSSHSNKPTCLAIVHRDARDHVRLEATLAESDARKKAILESSLDPIITIDHHGVVTEFNRAAEQTFGHPREKVLGTNPSEVLFPPSKSAGHQDRIERYLTAGEGSMLGRRVEVTAVRANGETFPAEMAMTISQEHGAPVMTFFVRDISGRKKAERQQARYAAELKRSNSELEQFAYIASHDLQEPLRKIRAFGDRLEKKCGDVLDETGTECLGRMQDAAGRMQTLIEGLLTLSRVTTRQQKFERVDLGEVAREVVSDLEVQIAQAGGRVEVGKLPGIQADALQMRQLLQNLIGNAIKFRRADEPPVVKVHGRFVQGRRQRRAGRPAREEQCRVVVEDNGIGFDQTYEDRIFDVFHRLHPRDVYEGTGIGLPICRKICERHGGTITARSTPDKGATFEIILPVVHSKEKGK